MPANAPLPGKFDEDPRVHFDKTAGKFQYEDDETGQEWEWSEAANAWVPLIDESQWKAQQAAYAVEGVDESTPANAVIARDEKRNKKKTKDVAPPGSASSRPPAGGPSAPKKTAVWVSNLPPNTTPELLASVFQKAGVLLIGNDGAPRIKMYYDDEGLFNGDALIMYFMPGSVDLAITLLDDTELELGADFGNMRVKIADYDKSQSNQNQKQEKKPQTEQNGSSNGTAAEGEKKRKAPTAEEKKKMTKRIKKMQDKLTWHSDDESDLEGDPRGGAPKRGDNRFSRVVVLKGMFQLEDIAKEPELMIELKEEVREEAETMGEVTSVILYDKEEDGVMTVKFKDPLAAQQCITKMNGRWFDGRMIYAGLYAGRERFQRSGAGGLAGEEEEKEEKERLDNFAQWLVDGEEAA